MRTSALDLGVLWMVAILSLPASTGGHGGTARPSGAPVQSGASATAGASKGERVLKHSDVVAMYDASLEVCRAFSISAIGWGGRPRSAAEVAAFRKETVEPLHRIGVQYVGSVGMVTEFGLFMDQCPEWQQAICLTPRGERLRVPWLWDQSHGGNPAYWFCTNDPRYRKFLRDQVVLAARAGTDGVHIDDHLGASATSWLDGCFCDSCVQGFRAYLRRHAPSKRLQELNIGDPSAFNYRDFVRQWLEAHPGRHAAEAPLGEEYRVYQFRAAEALMAELRALAEKTAGHPLTFSANAGLPDAAQMSDYRVLTQFSAEVDQAAASGLEERNVNAVIAYRLAAALNRPLAATASGGDWAFVKANRRPELVRAWIAQAYAFGQFLMTPHHQWCYTEQLGTHWYDGPPEEYGPIYRFIREHAFLFDDQESAAQVAVLHSTGTVRGDEEVESDVVRQLLKAQMSFDVVVAGNDWVPARLTWEQVRRYRKVIVPTDLALDDAQQRVIDRLRREGRLVAWKGPETLASLPTSWTKVDGADRVWAVLRRDPSGKSAVCHLLNRDYDASTDRVRPTGPFTVTVSAEATGRQLRSAVLYAPGAGPRPLKASYRGESITFEVPSLPLWAVVQLSPDAPPAPHVGFRAALGSGVMVGPRSFAVDAPSPPLGH